MRLRGLVLLLGVCAWHVPAGICQAKNVSSAGLKLALEIAAAQDPAPKSPVPDPQAIKYPTRRGAAAGQAYSHYLKGLIYSEDGSYGKALEELVAAKKLDPRSLHIRLKLSTILIRMGDVEKAEKELKEAKRIDSQNLDASLALLFLYSYRNDEPRIDSEYEYFLEKSNKINPDDLKISEYLGQFYFYKGRYKEAADIYKTIVEKNPEYAEGLFWLGYFYEELSRHKDAIAVWEKSVKLAPDYAPALNSLGYVYAEENVRLDEAEAMIQKALAQEPQNGAYLDSLGWVYFKKKDNVNAEKYLLSAIEALKDPVIYAHLGDLYVSLDKTEEAVKFYKEGLDNFPDDKDLKKKLETYGKAGRKDKIVEK